MYFIQHSARMRQKRQRRNRCWFWITATGNGSIIPVVFSPTRLKKTSFEFDEEDGTVSADILQIDARFVSLIKWLGENHINVRLSGENRADGYAAYKIREIAFGGATKLSAEDGSCSS